MTRAKLPRHRTIAFLLAVATSLLDAQSTSAPTPLRAQSLGVADNLYLLSGGGGGNALMMTAENAVVLVDTGSTASGAALATIASTISDQPVTTVIYSHAHTDHTGGAAAIPGNPRILAHEQAKLALQRIGMADRLLPADTVADSMTLFDGPDRIELRYFGRGHTSGDLVVVFAGKRLALLGDLFPGKVLPVVDRSNGGSYVELPQTLARAAAALTGVTRIIPGHASPPPGSPLARWITLTDLQEYADFTRDLLAAVQSGLQSGQNADQIAAGWRVPARYASYNVDGLRQTIQAISEEIGR